MNLLVEEYARKNGLLTVSQACEQYGTTKIKIKDLVRGGHLKFITSPLDKRVKLLKEKELSKVMSGRKGSSSSATNGGGGD